MALSLKNPWPDTFKRTARWLLQACVVALGFGMNLTVVIDAGRNGMVFAAGTILLTVGIGVILGRWLRINSRISALISAGTSICGGSAIAAVGSVIGAAEGEISVAMGTIFLLNAAALYVFPAVGHFLQLSETQFGTWAGVAIHDISSVVGAAALYGQSALETATAVKLSRSLWIVPVALGASLAFHTARPRCVTSDTIGFDSQPASPEDNGKLQIPWFIGLFLLAALARSVVPGAPLIAPTASHLATVGMTVTLFLIGAGISSESLRAVGWKPLLQGLLLWIVISAGSLIVVVSNIR
jgi:uncharacterized integral membrane protein (TIGR00698 family)